MKTELIIFHRPNKGLVAVDVSLDVASTTLIDTPNILTSTNGVNFNYRLKNNPGESITKGYQSITRPASKSSGGLSVDLYENVAIPITYTILDVREPDKRKTSWSKTVTLPGSANNNRIFSHIYEVSQDGWVTIGSTSVYEGFNPNIRKEIIILNDGIQVLKGNLQLKKIKRDANGNIEYEVALTGELTSLFYDVGNSKITDLDFSEWDHYWSRDNIKKSWGGTCVKNGVDYNVITDSGTGRTISSITRHAATGRILVTTTTGHSWQEGDWVRIDLTGANTSGVNADRLRVSIGSSKWYYDANSFETGYGNDYQIAEKISSTQFTINAIYPIILPSSGVTINNAIQASTVYKRTSSGSGYVYPLIDWGLRAQGEDDSWPVTSFAPGFYVKEIFDKIMEETNSKYESDFLNSEFFKRLILIQKKSSYDLNPAEIRNRKFQVGLTQSYETGASFYPSQQWRTLQMTVAGTDVENNFGSTASLDQIFPAPWPQPIPFAAETGSSGTSSFYDNGLTDEGSSYGNWDENTYRWVVQETGEYQLSASVKISCWLDMNGFAGGSIDGTASFAPSNPNNYKYYPARAFTGTHDNKCEVLVRLQRKRAGVVTKLDEVSLPFKTNNASYWTPTNPNWPFFGRYQPQTWNNATATLYADNSYFAKNDEVYIEVFYKIASTPTVKYAGSGAYGSYPSRNMCYSFSEFDYTDPEGLVRSEINGEWFVKLESQSFIGNLPSPVSTENSLIQSTSFLPKDLTCKDFLLSIIKMFNLHIEQDAQIDRKYYIEPRDDFYKDGSNSSHFEDWTDKIENDSVDIEPMGELIARYYTFENAKESDYWNKRFLEDRGRDYMKYTYEVKNDFLKNENKISIPLGSSVMINLPENTDVVVPSIVQYDANKQDIKPVSNSKPRILIWGGMKPYVGKDGGDVSINWELVSQENIGLPNSNPYRSYPFAGTVDSPKDPIYDINWYNMENGDFVYWDSARWSNGNLFNRFWRNMMLEISDPASKVITVDVRLTPSDIFNLDFKKIYVIDGNWLRLQKVIDYDPIGDGVTKCELLKLRSPSRFKLRSSIIDVVGWADAAESEADTTGPIVITYEEAPPAIQKPLTGYNNTGGGTLTNNPTVTTNGVSNNISAKCRNIVINGNECSVGSNCSNVNISGGNGISIAGGLSNINIIGTNNKRIIESDVTYINGVRYKNGIAISKSSVINGGLDVAYNTDSETTTANVVNAGEDVVITPGSSTWENVIDSGVDAILPDLAELGITTQTNQNPRTNLAGGFVITSFTQSQIEIVRDTAIYKSKFDTR